MKKVLLISVFSLVTLFGFGQYWDELKYDLPLMTTSLEYFNLNISSKVPSAKEMVIVSGCDYWYEDSNGKIITDELIELIGSKTATLDGKFKYGTAFSIAAFHFEISL